MATGRTNVTIVSHCVNEKSIASKRKWISYTFPDLEIKFVPVPLGTKKSDAMKANNVIFDVFIDDMTKNIRDVAENLGSEDKEFLIPSLGYNQEEKVFEVLVEIIRSFMDNGKKNIEDLEKEIVEGLLAKGYEVEEINDLLDSVFDLMNLDNRDFTLRVLTEEELPNFSDEAKSYLIGLKNNLILGEEEFEKAIFELSVYSNYNNVIDVKRYLISRGINPDITFS
jgi:hypothetical protein